MARIFRLVVRNSCPTSLDKYNPPGSCQKFGRRFKTRIRLVYNFTGLNTEGWFREQGKGFGIRDSGLYGLDDWFFMDRRFNTCNKAFRLL